METEPEPHGAMVAVLSHAPDGTRYLLLHSADNPRGVDGDWAWGSPSGGLESGETIAECAARELYEETGIRGRPQPVITCGVAWAIYFIVVPWQTNVRLDPAEHNDYRWVTYEDACRMCRPVVVADSFRAAVKAAAG